LDDLDPILAGGASSINIALCGAKESDIW
jgi:hypothetical protein